MIEGKVITLGVPGGIAVYKAADLASKLTNLGASVSTIMTESALEFVKPVTFQALTKNPVYTDLFSSSPESKIPHIDLAASADLFLIAPATANIIGKIAGGIADDLLSTSVLAANCPILICPAMNVKMYSNPIVQANISKLKGYGFHFLEPELGLVACGDYGRGRFPDLGAIIGSIEELLGSAKDLEGVSFLITAGGTREAIDPVRYISNRSSGKMGYALAKAVRSRGGKVLLISTPTCLEIPVGVESIIVESAMEMRAAVLTNYPHCQVVIKAAAVADYRCESVSSEKIKKDGESLTLKLTKNPDILAELGSNKSLKQTLVGFAAETQFLDQNAKKKLTSKNLDLLVANDITVPGSGFGSDNNKVKLFYSDGRVEDLELLDKLTVANKIIDAITGIRSEKQSIIPG
jgi:phosphopantothenoylcysteine decarboxylase/phosphopantothenate--cysteine ligase